MTTVNHDNESAITEYVTTMIGGQLFGLPISRVQDVFMPERLTRVPLASNDVAGVLNLRGRIVTAIDMRARLGLPKERPIGRRWLSVSNCAAKSYGLLIDSIGEVMKLPDEGREVNPANLDPRMTEMSAGVHRLDGQLMVVLDVERVLEIVSGKLAA